MKDINEFREIMEKAYFAETVLRAAEHASPEEVVLALGALVQFKDALADLSPTTVREWMENGREVHTWRWLHWGKFDTSWACPCGDANGRMMVKCRSGRHWRPMKPSILDKVKAGATYDAALTDEHKAIFTHDSEEIRG